MLGGWLAGYRFEAWTKLFLITTILTSVTGFGFPFHGFTPALGFGIISLVVLAITSYALHSRHLIGAWRWIFVVTAVIALYLNFFVLVVMAFRRVPALHVLAPTQSERPFQVTQLFLLVLFAIFGIIAVRKFGREPVATI